MDETEIIYELSKGLVGAGFIGTGKLRMGMPYKLNQSVTPTVRRRRVNNVRLSSAPYDRENLKVT